MIVSNRGPVGFRRVEGELRTVRGAGGLVSALRPLVDRHDVAWVATALGEGDREVAAGGPREERLGEAAFRLHLVELAPEVYAPYYRVLANPVLWFVQHGLWELKRDPTADLSAAWADGYVAANRALAAAAVEELDALPGAPLLVQDYHLYLVPALVREARPDARIAHFVHIPWVGPDGWSVLPEPIVRAVHEGLLAADSIGFHRALARRVRRDLRGGARPGRRRGGSVAREPDRDRRGRPRAAGREPGRPGAPTRAAGRPPRAPRAARRPHRPVEERRPRLRGLRTAPRARAGARGEDPTARAPRPVAPGRSRSTSTTGTRPRPRPPRSTPASAAPAGSPFGSTCATTSPRPSRRSSSTTSCS